MVQPVEKNINKSNSTERFKSILRHELELKWIKRLQTPFPLGFNDNIYHEGNISEMPDFHGFSLLDIKKKNVINDPMVSAKMGILNENIKNILSLVDLNILLNFGRHQMLSNSFIVSFFIPK